MKNPLAFFQALRYNKDTVGHFACACPRRGAKGASESYACAACSQQTLQKRAALPPGTLCFSRVRIPHTPYPCMEWSSNLIVFCCQKTISRRKAFLPGPPDEERRAAVPRQPCPAAPPYRMMLCQSRPASADGYPYGRCGPLPEYGERSSRITARHRRPFRVFQAVG